MKELELHQEKIFDSINGIDEECSDFTILISIFK